MNLSKSTSVLRNTHLPSGKSQTFATDAFQEGEDPNHGKLVTMMNGLWEDLGSPDVITVTIQPGDHLNDEG